MITSTKNPAVSEVKSLISKASQRRETGLFAAEGKRLCLDLIKSGTFLEKAYVTEDFLAKEEEYNIPYDSYEIVSENVLKAMGDTKTPQGIIGLFKLPDFSATDIFKGKDGENALCLILDGISDPGNLGTMIRGFEACGGSGIILLNDCTDPFGAKCIRSTMGSLVRLPVIRIKDAKALLDILDKYAPDMKLFSCHMEGKDYDQADLTGPVGLVIGNEARGISKELKDLSDDCIRIPMKGELESLNAAVSALVVGFEAQRQRRNVK